MFEYANFEDYYCIDTQYKFIFFPKRCHTSNKFLWLEYCYVQTVKYIGPGKPVRFSLHSLLGHGKNRYFDKNEFLLARIKGIA
jgi:hypothetical protein